jgi:uncharacterized protein (DUF1697 family)
MPSDPLVVFLRGVNVGGHRTFRPKLLAERLKHLDAVNIGAAGTVVIRKPVPLKQLRAELSRLLPFETMVAICHGQDIARLMAGNVYGDAPPGRDVVRFISVLPNKKPRVKAPLQWPATGQWLVRVLCQHGRFIVGEYRRNMKTISYLGGLDKVVGEPITTRNWNTISTIARTLSIQSRPDRRVSERQ